MSARVRARHNRRRHAEEHRHGRDPGSGNCERQAHPIPPGKTGQNRRLAGEDLHKGKPALHAGTLLRPAELG